MAWLIVLITEADHAWLYDAIKWIAILGVVLTVLEWFRRYNAEIKGDHARTTFATVGSIVAALCVCGVVVGIVRAHTLAKSSLSQGPAVSQQARVVHRKQVVGASKIESNVEYLQQVYTSGVAIQRESTWMPNDALVNKINAEIDSWVSEADAGILKRIGPTAQAYFDDTSRQVDTPSFRVDGIHRPGAATEYILAWTSLGQHLQNLRDLMANK